jgi:hypothetical protein
LNPPKRRPRTEARHRRQDHGSEGLTKWGPVTEEEMTLPGDFRGGVGVTVRLTSDGELTWLECRGCGGKPDGSAAAEAWTVASVSVVEGV